MPVEEQILPTKSEPKQISVKMAVKDRSTYIRSNAAEDRATDSR